MALEYKLAGYTGNTWSNLQDGPKRTSLSGKSDSSSFSHTVLALWSQILDRPHLALKVEKLIGLYKWFGYIN